MMYALSHHRLVEKEDLHMRVKGLKRGLGIGLAFVLSAVMAIPGAAVDTFAAEVEDSILEPESSTVYNLNSTVKLSDFSFNLSILCNFCNYY